MPNISRTQQRRQVYGSLLSGKHHRMFVGNRDSFVTALGPLPPTVIHGPCIHD